MEPSGELPKLQIDDDELTVRYIESRLIERSILDCLHYLLNTLKKGGNPDYHKDLLEHNLQRRFNDWQFFYDDKEGLNSGGCGEAFTRLMGTGIMDNMPELCEIPKNTDEMGVFITKKPKDKSDKGIIDVVTTVGRSSDIKGCKFRFTASQAEIDNRIHIITEEIEKKRQEETEGPEEPGEQEE